MKTLLGLLVLACAAVAAPAPSSHPLRAAFPGRDPVLRWDGAGNLHVVSVDEAGGEPAVWYRRLGASAAGPVRVSPPGVKVSTEGEAPPVLAALPGGTLVVAYPVALPGRWKSEIRVQRSTDGGATWSPGVLPHPQRDGSHSYVSGAVTASGLLVLAWLDNSTGHMGLHTAATRDGLAFTPPETLDPATCQCCGTAMLAGRSGGLWLAYRGLEEGNLRDFQVLRAAPAAPRFTARTKLSRDGWRIDGCPETGARLAEAADGTLWAAWFTAGGRPALYTTSSRDKGATFAPRAQVSPAGGLFRHPEVGILPDGRIAVLFEHAQGGDLQARLRDPRSGRWGEPERIAPRGIYPRLAVAGDRTALAFTCQAGQGTRAVVTDWQPGRALDLRWTGCD